MATEYENYYEEEEQEVTKSTSSTFDRRKQQDICKYSEKITYSARYSDEEWEYRYDSCFISSNKGKVFFDILV
jgi:hypothetical protein